MRVFRAQPQEAPFPVPQENIPHKVAPCKIYTIAVLHVGAGALSGGRARSQGGPLIYLREIEKRVVTR